MSKKGYTKMKSAPGVYKYKKTGCYLVMKKIKGKSYQQTFSCLAEAKNWRKTFDGIEYKPLADGEYEDPSHATLEEVWKKMQEVHFPSLATSTKMVWIRRYELLKDLEHLRMNKITPSKITSWVNKQAAYFKSEKYQNGGRGNAKRCNMNNELNMFVTIFNWYKSSEQFEQEAVLLTCPVKLKHKKMGFIKPVPDKKRQIDLEDAFLFFEYLRPLYKNMAMLQFYCAARIGEIAGLQWSNIDLKNRRMLIKHAVIWDSHKKFLELKPFPKNREARPVFITDEIKEILEQRLPFKEGNCDYVFHVEKRPINYGAVLVNYREAQRKSGVPYSGTHILRHGMAKLARKVGGGLDAVIAMTGHKDLKLADHYSKSNEDDQKYFSEKIMGHIRSKLKSEPDTAASLENVLSLENFKKVSNK